MRCALAALSLLASPALLAAGFAAPNTNPRDQAMAGSAVANQEGPEAAHANGAALAGLEGFSVSASGGAILLSTNWQDPASAQTAQTVAPAAKLPTLNLAYGAKAFCLPWAVGAAFMVAGGGQVAWAGDWVGRGQILSVDRRIYSLDVVGAVQPIEQLKVSLGGALFVGVDHLQKALQFGATEGAIELGGSGSKLSWTAALEAKPLKEVPLKLGLRYQHKADLVLQGAAHFSNVPLSFQPSALDQSVSETLTFPNLVMAGFAVEPLAGLTLQGAFTWWRWSIWKEQVFTGAKGLVVRLPADFANCFTWHAGAEHKGALPGLRLRAGLARDLTPQPTTTLSPASPGSSKWAVAIGAGYDLTAALALEASYEVSPFDTNQSSGDAFPGRYDTTANLFSLGVVFRMK